MERNEHGVHPKFAQYMQQGVAGGGGPPHDVEMEHRVTALETRLDTTLPTLATKQDIGDVRSDISRWMLATVLTVIGTVLAAIIGLNTIWKSPSPSQPQQSTPVIIQVPAYVTPSVAPANTSSTQNPARH